MKKYFICSGTVILILILLLSVIVLPRSNTKKANAVISSDYSTITYKGKVYVPIQVEELPLEVKNIGMMTANDMIKATVENENYFLDKYFLTNYISIIEIRDETFIYLHTDYDINESDYYCSKTYKGR